MLLRLTLILSLSHLTWLTAASECSGAPRSTVVGPQSQEPAAFASKIPSNEWTRLSSAGFTVVGNAPAKELRRAGIQLQRFQQAMRQMLGPLDFSSPVPNVLVVFKDDKAMLPFKPRDGRGRTSENVAGYFSGGADVNYMVMATMYREEWTLSVLFHEYTHYIVHRNMGRVPQWVSEGVAEFFSTFQVNADGEATVGTVPTFRVNALRRRRLLPLDKMLTNAPAEVFRNDADLYYAQSWGLVHYLLMNKARQGQLAAYLRALESGKPVQVAFREAFHASFDEMETELRRYLLQFRIPILKLPVAPDLVGAPEAAPTAVRDAEALQLQGDLLMRMGAFAEARVLLQRALGFDLDDRASQISMASVRLRQDEPSEAVERLMKAVEGAPDDFRAQYWLGVALSSAERYKEALTALAAAVKANNGSPGIWHEVSISALAIEDHRNAELAMNAVQRLDSDPSWFYARSLRAFAIGKFDYATRDAEAYLREAGLGDEVAPYASFVGALAYARIKDNEKARALLRQVKASVAEASWESTLARFLDADIDAAALLDKAKGNGQETEAHAYIGLMAVAQGHEQEALPHLQWVKEKGGRTYREYALAIAELKRLHPADASTAPH